MKLIAHNDGVELRGNERQLVMISAGLRDHGHNVLVSARSGTAIDQALRARSIVTSPIRPRGDLDFLAAWAFRGWLREQRPDAVLLTSWKRVLTGAWAARKASVPRIAVRLGIVRAAPARGRRAWRLRKAFNKYVDVLVVNSNDVADVWRASAPWFPSERVQVIQNAVEPVPGTRETLRSDLGVGPDVKLIACVGALEHRKGMDVMLHALRRLPSEVRLMVAGQGPDAEMLKVMASSLEVADRVYWLGPRSDVPDVLAASDAFVSPSRQDSLANSLLEAMSAGLPIIATRGTGVGDALDTREGRPRAGWIVAAEDDAALADAVSAALRSSAAERAEAEWRAKHWFTVERMVTQYEQLLFGA